MFKKKSKAVELGVEARDIVSGFTGIVTGYAVYLTGCKQFSLVPKVDKDGKERLGAWFDDKRVEYVGPGVSVGSLDTGGPQSEAPVVR